VIPLRKRYTRKKPKKNQSNQKQINRYAVNQCIDSNQNEKGSQNEKNVQKQTDKTPKSKLEQTKTHPQNAHPNHQGTALLNTPVTKKIQKGSNKSQKPSQKQTRARSTKRPVAYPKHVSSEVSTIRMMPSQSGRSPVRSKLAKVGATGLLFSEIKNS